MFDFSHGQTAALIEIDAQSIDSAHPEWYTLGELAKHVTSQLDEAPMMQNTLDSTDVLVVAAHEVVFSSSEIAVVRDFVSSGGGLLLIGNGGMSTAAAAIAAGFGLQFLPGSIKAQDHLWDSVSFDVRSIAEHPITECVDSLQMNYAAPMDVDDEWIVLAKTSADVWQETGSDDTKSPGERSGPFPVVACREYGDGRVAAVCDDAPFRGFGNATLVHNLISWLAGKSD